MRGQGCGWFGGTRLVTAQSLASRSRMRASQQGTPLPFSVEALLARDTSTSTRGQTADSAPAETGDTETTNLPDSTVDDDNIEKVNIMNASDLNLLCPKLKQEEDESPPASLRVGGVVVQLLDSQLWRSFHSLGTEMIITKAGRSVDTM